MPQTFLETNKKLFSLLIGRIHDPDFLAQSRVAPTDFTRRRSLPFPVLITFLMQCVNSSVQSGLNAFFQTLHASGAAVQTVSHSAFTQARAKLKPEALASLNRELVAHFHASACAKHWRGRRVLAVDGLTLRLPHADPLFNAFGKQRYQHTKPYCVAQASLMFDVLNTMAMDLQVRAYPDSERDLLCAHLPHTQAGDVLVMDRGYPGFWVFQALQAARVDAVVRIELNLWQQFDAFARSGLDEQIIVLEPSDSMRKACRKRGLQESPILIRAIRLTLPNGQMTVLATTLMDQPAAEITGLYRLRWRIEEQIKHLKCRLEMERFTGVTEHAVRQDLYAALLLANLDALLTGAAYAQLPQDSEKPKQIPRVRATAVLLSFLPRLLLKLAIPNWEAVVISLARSVVAIRPNRSSPRPKPVKNCRPRYNAYKSVRA